MAQTQTGEVTATAPLSGTAALTFTSRAAELNITTASWRTLGRLYRELDMTKPGLEIALQNWLRYRTEPPGVVIDWRASRVLRTLDIEHSTVRLMLGGKWRDVGIYVLPPDEAPLPSADAPAAPVKQWRKQPPPKELKAAALKAAETFQSDDPPTQAEWWKAMKEHLPEVSRDAAISAQPPHLLRKRGQKPNRGS